MREQLAGHAANVTCQLLGNLPKILERTRVGRIATAQSGCEEGNAQYPFHPRTAGNGTFYLITTGKKCYIM